MTENFFTKIQVWREGELGMIAFDNSEENPLDEQLLQQFSAALSLAQSDDKVRIIGVTGSGESYFSVGVSWDAISSFASFMEAAHSVSSLILSTTKPVVAMVNGHALGAGLELALLSDFKLLAGNVVAVFPECQHGLPPVMGGFLAACETCGPTWAKRLFVLGEELTAETARNIGLADEVFPKQNFFGDCRRWVEMLAPRLKFFSCVKNVHADPAKLKLMREIEKGMVGRLATAWDPSSLDGLKRARVRYGDRPAEL